MESRIGKVLSYLGSFLITTGILVAIVLVGMFRVSSLIMLVSVSLGVIMHGIARVIALQEEILKMGSFRADCPETEGDGLPGIE